MARDRKRAKQRRQRQGAATRAAEPYRRDLPGALQHSSGEVDEFDAALVRGSQPEPEADDGALAVNGGLEEAEEPEEELEELDEADEAEDESKYWSDAEAPGGGRGGIPARPVARGPVPVPGARVGLGSRAVAFLRASWAELQRVQWPDRRQVAQATAVVMGFVAIAGVYLGVADWVAQKIVNAIL